MLFHVSVVGSFLLLCYMVHFCVNLSQLVYPFYLGGHVGSF